MAEDDDEFPSYCSYCFSERPSVRRLVHEPGCMINQAWDCDGISCDCRKASYPYRCRSKFHRTVKPAATVNP